MSLSSRCPECGAELPEGAGLLKLCPRCLLKQALPGESTEASPEPAQKTRSGLPERYGAYRPVGVLGEGGMGIVYLAEQDQPIRRRVALKVIKQGMDTRQVIARFESERQALALMDHPNIAHVYDAGATPEGRPYFAMEYVPGIPITDYCDKYLLGTRERLDLFMKVCAAIQHAHQKGVIHRDIKPSNVLVMIQDGKPVPKVIDFGVAKATNQRLTEKTMFTEFGVLIGTPAYMSPEQAELTGLDVDSTTDIYSLGVLLYELLVGALPFDAQMLKKAGYDEIRRIIREVEPPRPTIRLHSMGPTATGVARRRQSDVRSLERLLRGDLDWIAMKALEKDRTRRYPSASEFAADVLRHLSDEPVQASPPSTAYRARKFLHKHRAGVLAVAGLVTVSLIGAAVSSVMYVRAERQRSEALRQSYVANIYAANLHLNSGEKDAAIRRLLQCAPDLRGWEWRHLWYRADSSIATLHTPQHFRNYPFFSTFGFSPDGSRVYWNAQLTLPVWDASSYQPITTYGGFGEILALAKDGTKILARQDHGLNVVNPATGAVLSKLPVKADDVQSAAFSADGLLAGTGSRGGTIRVWDLASGLEMMQIQGHQSSSFVVFSPDSRRIASGSTSADALDGRRTISARVAIWDVRSGKLLAAMTGDSRLSPPEFSPDGTRLAAGTAKGTISVWDTSTGELALTLSGHQGAVGGVAFSPDGSSIASVSRDNTVRIWDANSGGLLSTLIGDNSTNLWSVGFSPDGTRLLAGSETGEIRVWDAIRFGGTLLKRAKQRIDAATISANGARIALGFPDRTVEVLDTASGKSLAQWIEGDKIQEECPRHSTSFCMPLFLRGISVMTLSPDGTRIVVALTGGAVHLRDTITGRELVSFSDPGNWAHVAFDASGSYVVSTRGDKTVRVWEASSGRALAMETFLDTVSSVTFSPKGNQILIASGHSSLPANDATVQIWDWRSGARPVKLDRGETSNWPTNAAEFSPDGSTVIADVSANGELSVWDTASRKLRRVIPGPEFGLSRITFSPDGSRFATADDRSLRVWDAATFELVLNSNTGATFVGFAGPDASLLLSVSNNLVHSWDTRSSYNPGPEQRGENRSDLNEKAWQVVKAPDRKAGDYREALRQIEIAVKADPWSPNELNTLGVAQYRNGLFREALESLRRSEELRYDSVNLIFTAMAHFKLGEADQARGEFRTVQNRLKTGPVDARAFLHEAEALIEGAGKK